MKHRPLLLLILDGFGYREEKKANAIASANAPTWQKLWQTCPNTLLKGSGQSVGLPEGQMGNSEVGHLTMGAGRVIYQDLTRISNSIADGSFFRNSVFLQALKKAKENKSVVHVLGLLSPGGVHSHEDHIHALLQFTKQEEIPEVVVHAFLDGRDTPPRSAKQSLQKTEELCKQLGNARIGSIMGRYYAMDRDKRYERTEKAYRLLTESIADFQADNAVLGLESAYARGENDEFVQPTLITNRSDKGSMIKNGDMVIFMNFRADRARQLFSALWDPKFNAFERNIFPQIAEFVTLTEYTKNLPAKIPFPSMVLENLLGEYLEKHNFRQLRIAETEKYAHITYFFNGGRDEPYRSEERILIPSPKIATYDLHPAMSSVEVTDKLTDAILHGHYDVIVCNYANADMVGHSGNFEATVAAIEALDECLSRIIEALKKVGGEAIITADHGNAEYMFDDSTGQPHTAHTVSPVPFVYFGRKAKITKPSGGALSDISPTMLTLLDLPIPKEMTGTSLLQLEE